MDDPGWSWPAWKFGLKRDDLFTKLHDQYNTFPSTIQDPEAFHHDVFEISHEATSTDEFHRLLASRREQRLRELNESLESAALEIIANPALVGTEQWQHALQLFRTKSLDSLVRYFASYLPDGHPWHRSDDEGADTDASDSIANSLQSSIFVDRPVLTHEPLSMSTAASTSAPTHLPPSPRSMTMCSDSSTDAIHHNYVVNTLTPARTLSFSESESEHFGLKDSCPHLRDDTSQSSDPETPVSSVSDLSEAHGHDFVVVAAEVGHDHLVHHDFPPSQLPADIMDSETPTPKSDHQPTTSYFFEPKPSPLSSSLRHRSVSPSSRAAHHLPNGKESRRSPRLRRRDLSPAAKHRRRSPGENVARVQKPLPDPLRTRPMGRRRMDTS